MLIVFQVKEVLTAATNASTNGTTGAKVPATPEGMAIAYGSLVIMALLPIFFGAFRSVKHHKEQKKNYQVKELELAKHPLCGVVDC